MMRCLAPVIGLLVLVTWIPTVAGDGSVDCSIRAKCCNASAGECRPDQVGTCSFTCGKEIRACSCSCRLPGEIRKRNPDLDTRTRLDESAGMCTGPG